MKTAFGRVIVLAGLIVSALTGAIAHGAVVYNNTVNYAGGWLYSGFELGDQINLAGSDRILTRFDFEYYGINLNANTAKAQVRFYMNNGPLAPSGFNMPGTLLFDSGPFPISTPANLDNRATLIFTDFSLAANPLGQALTQPLPNSFTWTVEFTGINTANNEHAGLVLYTPPVVGQSYTDYWENQATGWKLLVNGSGPIDFGASFQAVPEPSTVALFALGAIGLAGLIWRGRRRVR